jgi:replicative DNA helicase
MAQPQNANVPPQNLEAERSVLGAMLVSESAVSPVIDEVKLVAEDFYLDRHRILFACLRDLYAKSKPTDELSAIEALKSGGELSKAGDRGYISELAANVPAIGNAAHHARIVQENSLLRRLLGAGQQIQDWVRGRDGEPRSLAEDAERLLFEVAHEEQAGDFRRINEILHEEVDRLEKLSTGEIELTGTPSGFRDIDALTGGFQPGNLIVIAARPAMGKSAWVANIAENVAVKQKRPVAFFSLEMSEVELAQRFIACRARIPGDRLRKGKVSQKDWPRVIRAANELEDAPLWFDDSSDLGILDLRAKARRLHAQSQSEGGLGLVVVDYLQLMRADDMRANRVEQVGQMSRGLKILARELDVPVIAISQLSRAPEQRHPPRPQLSDLRESGQIEQDADLVAFLYREDAYGQREPDYEPTGLAEVIVAKHRNGPVGNRSLVFLDRFPKFADYTGQDQPIEQPAGEDGEAPAAAEAAF